MDWVEAAAKLAPIQVSQSGRKIKRKASIADREMLTVLMGWFDSVVADSTEGPSEAVSRRIVWVFPDSYSLTVGWEIYPTFSHLENNLEEEDVPLSPFEEGWSWDKSVNGWNILEGRESETPTLYLPVESYFWGAGEESEEDYVDGWGDDEDARRAFHQMITFLKDNLEFKLYGWDVKVCGSDDYIPEFSAYNKFWNLINELEQSDRWIVIADEHCAACCSGTRKSIIEQNPELEGKPEIITWGQNSEYSYYPDGSLVVEPFVDDEGLEEFRELTVKYDLNFTDDDFINEHNPW